jgi:hypothetical protein
LQRGEPDGKLSDALAAASGNTAMLCRMRGLKCIPLDQRPDEETRAERQIGVGRLKCCGGAMCFEGRQQTCRPKHETPRTQKKQGLESSPETLSGAYTKPTINEALETTLNKTLDEVLPSEYVIRHNKNWRD